MAQNHHGRPGGEPGAPPLSMSNERAEQWQRRSMALRAAQDRYARDADWDRCRRAQKIRVDTYNRWCDEITKPKRDRRLILEALAYGREARAREALAAYQAAMQSDHEPPPIQRDYGDETTNI